MRTTPPREAEFPGISPLEIARSWSRFWFNPADPTTLGLIRICAGMVILYVHIAYTFDLLDFFGADAWINQKEIREFVRDSPWNPRGSDFEETDEFKNPPPAETEEDRTYNLKWGVHPKVVYARGFYAWSIWYLVSDPGWMYFIHGCFLVVFFFLMIGFCTRFMAVLAWLAALCYIQRSPVSLFGMDTITNLVLIYLMIGSSGAALSVDRLIERYRISWRSLRARASGRKTTAGSAAAADNLDLEAPRPLVSANLAIRCIQVHLCIIYFVSGISKLQGTTWWNFWAVWGTMANPEFSPVHIRIYKDILDYLVEHRWLWELAMSGAAIGTLVFEIGFAFLVWNRHLRWIMVLSAVAMHTAIAMFMGLTCFSLIMLCGLMSFVPQEAVHRLLDRLGQGVTGLRLAYAGRDRRQVRAAALVHTFDVWDQVRLVDVTAPARGATASAAETHALQLTTDSGLTLTGYPVFAYLTRALRLLWPLAIVTWIPGVSSLAKSRYPGIANAAEFSSHSNSRSSKGEKVTS